MRVDLFGLVMDAPGVTVYLWSPWRCSQLEHKLFDAVRAVPGVRLESDPDELRLEITDSKVWKTVVQAVSRVLKGWQEEAADGGTDKRSWRILIETDVDAAGYDAHGEKSSFWAFVRLALDRGGPNEPEKGEDIDLNGFGLCMWGHDA